MGGIIGRALAAMLAALVAGWRRDRAREQAAVTEAELRGLEAVNERAARADAASRAARADPERLRDDGHRRD